MTALQEIQALESHAAELHRRAIVIDGQSGKAPDPPSQVGGLTAMVITLGYQPYEDLAYLARVISTQLEYLDFYRDQALLIRTVEDIERAKREGKLGLIFCFQSTNPIGDDPSRVRFFWELGLRIIQLTYNERSVAGCGCMEPNDTGLTDYGRQFIRAMERVGILLDLSHVGRRTSLDALACATKPAVFSHSNPAALHEVPRNVTDEQIRAVAATGGVVGVTPVSLFIRGQDGPQPTVSDVVDHIAYVADLVGIDHVGVATDAQVGASLFTFSMGGVRSHADQLGPRPLGRMAAEGFVTRSEFPNVTLEMVKRGFSDEDILKVLGGNFVRVFRAAWEQKPFRP